MSADGYVRVGLSERSGEIDYRCYRCSRPIFAGSIERDHADCIETFRGERILRYSLEVIDGEVL